MNEDSKLSEQFFKKWYRKHEKQYDPTVHLFYYENDEKKFEDSANLENIAECFQCRGYIRKDEFVRIRRWKSQRNVTKMENRVDAHTIKHITHAAIKITDLYHKIKVLEAIYQIGLKHFLH